MKNKPILIVAGEPKSIFFEIYFKSLKIKKYKSPLILICCENLLKYQLKKFGLKRKINKLNVNNIENAIFNNKDINLINIKLENSLNFKKKINNTNIYINKCFEVAFKLIKNGFSKKFINGPINKDSFLQKKYLGVTEYISNKFKTNEVAMLIYNEKLSVCPVTTHLPLKEVAKNITKKVIEQKILLINNFFKKNLGISPNIGVAGLNPHCESVLKFNEDDKIVKLAIKSSIKKKIKVKGPFPADTIFLKKNRKKYHVILGMYHDQVLTPAKTIFEYDAINITMGLPFLRVSPDHGPNEKMVGKNMSNPESLIKALNFLDKK